MAGVGQLPSPDRADRRALVIGASPAGLAAALAVRSAGYTPVVLEQAAELREVGTALTLWPNALAALAELNLADDVAAVGCPAEGNQIRTPSGRLVDDVSGQAMREWFGSTGMTLLRSELIAVLLNRLGADAIRTGARCVGVTSTPTAVVAHLADGREETGALLIGVDGLHSVVRAQLVGGRDPLRYAGYPVWRGIAEYDLGRAPGSLSMGRGAQFGMFPMRGGRTYWFASLRMPPGVARTVTAAALLYDRFASWHPPIRDVLITTPAHQIIVTDVYDRRPLRRWRSGRVALVGDAAHPSEPTLGQGTCQALEDAAVLARCLRRGRTVDDALRAYEASRRRRANGLARQAAMLGRIGLWQNPLSCWLREQVMTHTPGRLRQRQLAQRFAFP